MFIGHYSVALAARAGTDGPRLGTYMLAAQWLDLIWPLFLLLGWERVRIDPGNTAFTPLEFVHYPYSHSLLAATGWSALFFLAYLFLRRNLIGALWLGGAVFSHWVLDWITHRPDLPMSPGSPVFLGLGLWNAPAGTVLLEGAMLAAAVFLYLRTYRHKGTPALLAFWSLVILLVLIYVATMLSPPPPGQAAIVAAGLALWLLVAWGYWIDGHWAKARSRQPATSPAE